jgi:hypothetical protein
VHGAGELSETPEQHLARHVSKEEVQDLVDPLVDRGLMLRDGASFLSLAIPLASTRLQTRSRIASMMCSLPPARPRMS